MTASSLGGEAPAYPTPWRAWGVVLILMATAVLSYTDRQVLSLLVGPLKADLGISDFQVSLLLGSAFAFVYGVAGVPLGALADRVSRRNLIAAGLVVWSLGTLACSLSQTFAQIFAGRLLVGLGEAALAPAAIALISDDFPPERRGAAVGLFLSGIAVGVGASIFIGGAVLRLVEAGVFSGGPFARLAPWRLVLMLVGAPGLVWVLAILAIREPSRRSVDPALPAVPQVRGQWLRAAPIFGVLALASLADNAVGAWAPSLLIRTFAMAPSRVGLVLGVVLAAGYGGGVFLGGLLADRAGARGGRRLKAGLCLAAGLALLPISALFSAASADAVLIGAPLYFALSGVVTAVGFSALLDRVPAASRGLAMAISFFLNVAVGAGLGPTLVVLAADHLIVGHGLGPALTLVIAGGYGLSSLALLAVWRPGRVFK